MRKRKSPIDVTSVVTARGHLSELVDQTVGKKERFLVQRRGEPAAVLMSFDDYLDIIAPTPAWMKRWDAEIQRKKIKVTKRDIDRAIAEVRAEAREAKAQKPNAS